MKPVNRHLTIVPHIKRSETQTGVLLPDDFKQEDDRYITATVLDVASDCASVFQKMRGHSTDSRVVVVERSMIEEIEVADKSYFTVLENYIVGILRGANENQFI